MIPQDFKDYFVNSEAITQQEIVSLLLSLSGLGTEIREVKDQRAVNCPHCKGNPHRC